MAKWFWSSKEKSEYRQKMRHENVSDLKSKLDDLQKEFEEAEVANPVFDDLYDAVYAALSQIAGAPLITADYKFWSKIKKLSFIEALKDLEI